MALISNNIIDLVQLRIKNEQQSSRLYSAMSNFLSLKGYEGATSLYDKYSKEELIHASWAKEYLLDLNILPIEPSQEQPPTEFKGLPQIIALTYQHELKITEECKEFAAKCLAEGDMLSFNLSQKYTKEQIEEMAKATFLVDQLNLYGDGQVSLRLLDEKMGKL